MNEPAAPPEREIAAPLLRRVLTTIIVTAILIGVLSALTHVTQSMLLAGGNVVIAVAMLALAERGWIRTASIVVVCTLVVTALFAMATGDRLHDDAVLILPGIFLFTSLLLGGAWAVATACVSMAAVVVVGLLEIHGGLVARPGSHATSYHELLEIVVLLGTLATFAHYVVELMRKALADARNAHQSVRDIIDATTEAIFIHDAKDGRIVEVNAPTREMFGTEREELLGQRPFDIRQATDEHDGARAADYLRRAVSEGPQSFEWSTLRKDGTQIWVEVSLRSALIAGEARVIAVVRDVTERRRLEQRLREAETFRAVGQLAGGVAHDFNNQLVGILGNAEFLCESLPTSSEQRDCAESILTSGRRAADLTQQLLAFARKGFRRNVAVDLHQLVREVVALGKRSIDKRIVIEQDLSAAESTVEGDPSALQNAILNLLLNARDAMPMGGTVTFRTSRWEGIPADFDPALLPGKYVVLEVTDVGIGIEEAVIGRIFEPFFTTKESGTGMGLAAVKGTVLDHRGGIAVESRAGVGTKFRLCLPLTNKVAQRDAPHPVAVRPKSAGRILVIDDEPAVTQVIERALELGGFAVDSCANGFDGLARYRPVEHELILLDVMMPDLDGVEVLRRLRATRPDVKVMLMSGHASDAVEERLREFSDVTVVAKPFSVLQLVEEVRKRLDG